MKKRQYRRLWIQRVGAAARLNGITYGQLIHGLKAAGVTLDRKVLADIAVKDAAGFAQLVEKAKAFAPKPGREKGVASRSVIYRVRGLPPPRRDVLGNCSDPPSEAGAVSSGVRGMSVPL